MGKRDRNQAGGGKPAEVLAGGERNCKDRVSGTLNYAKRATFSYHGTMALITQHAKLRRLKHFRRGFPGATKSVPGGKILLCIGAGLTACPDKTG